MRAGQRDPEWKVFLIGAVCALAVIAALGLVVLGGWFIADHDLEWWAAGIGLPLFFAVAGGSIAVTQERQSR